MPALSHRITHLTDDGSGGWDLFIRARKMIAEGIDVTELTIGEHDIRTDPVILDAMHQSALTGHTGYASVPGTDSLRDAVAARVTSRTGVATSRDEVLITPGGQAALFASHIGAADPGARALYIDPYYATYPGTIRGAGLEPITVPTRPEDAFQPTKEAIRTAAAGTAKTLLINSPNNPTGVVYSPETIQHIADAAQSEDLWLISDEVYDTQIWSGTHISPRALPGMAERTLVIGSMSKSHAMTGSRIGWIIGPPDMIDHLTNLATHTTYGVPGYIQDAAEFALTAGDALETEVGAPFARRRALAEDILSQQNILHLIPSSGAMYLMLDVRTTGLSGDDFANHLLDMAHIAVMPGESFGEAAGGHIRVAMTVDDDRFAAALGQIVATARDLT